MGSRRGARRLAPAGVAFVLAVILFAPATLGGRVLSASDIPLFAPPFPPQPAGAQPQNPLQFDAANVFEPDGLLVRDALRGLRLPVWTQSQSAGQPLLASQQSAPLFPLTWLSALLPYWDSLAWIAVLKLVLAFAGTYLLARALRLGAAAGLIAGLSFGFGSYLVDWLSHPHSNAYLLLPWVFLCAERLLERARLRDAGLLALALGIAYLGGQPESSMLVTLAVAAWFIYRVATARRTRAGALRRPTLLAGGALVLGVALAAVMLIPFAEALRQSYDTSRAQPALPGRSLLTVVFPELWGRPDRPGLSIGPSNFSERTLYVGVLPLLLALAGLFARRPRGPQLFFAVLGVVSLVVALDTGPLAKAARHIPVVDLANLNRALVLASFALAMLAAFGWQRFADADARERRRMLIAAAALGCLPVLIAVAANPSWLGHLPDAVRRLFGGGASAGSGAVALASVIRWLLFAALAIAVLVLPFRLRSRGGALAALAALALMALDLIGMGWGYNPAIRKAQAEPPRPPALAVAQRLAAGGSRVTGLGALEPNTASRWGLKDARGHEDPVIERPQKLWAALAGGIDTAFFGGTPPARGTARPLDVFGVRAVVLGPPGSDLERRLRAGLPGMPVAYSGPGGVVLANPHALPPAFVAYRWRTSSGLGRSLDLMRSGTSAQARDDPVIETAAAPPSGPPQPATPALVLSRSDSHVTIAVQANAPGRLVLLDTYYPGWSATVDGKPVHVDAADAAFRAVPVGAGRHTVRFSYEPGSVLAGGVISIVALVAIALSLVLGAPRYRRSEPEEPAHPRD
jgi:membrane protein YfhO